MADGAKSVKDRAENGEHQAGDDDLELLPRGSVDGEGLKRLVKQGKDNAFEVKIRAIAVPSKGGLADPEKVRTLLVSCEPGKSEEVPHKEDGQVVRYTTRQHYMPVYVEAVQRGDAGRLESAFKQLLLDDPTGAAKALDVMKADAAAELGEP